MIKIKVSYRTPGELQMILNRLGSAVESYSKPYKGGDYYRVYILVKSPE